MGRIAVGVLGIKLREGDYVVGAARAQGGKDVLSITEKGYGKRTPVEEYRITKRNAYGIKNYMLTMTPWVERPHCLMASTGVRIKMPASVTSSRSSDPSTTLMPTTCPVFSVSI